MDKDQTQRQPPARPRGTAKLLGVVAFAALVILLRVFDLSSALKEALSWIHTQGAWGAVVFLLLY